MELLFRLCLAFQSVLRFILEPIFRYYYRDKLPPVPAIKNPLLKMPAAVVAKKIRRGELSSQTIVQAYIERIKEVNPYLNAMVDERFEEALRDAKTCDEKLKSGEVSGLKLEKEKPLYGVPFTVKESCSLKGLSYTGCTLVRKGVKAPADSFVVEALRNAGGIPLCVTNTPELCTGFDSANLLYGRTLNPYDRRHVAGGSSGGEGALLGAGASLIGLGSDIAGSIRLPALFNGVFGHKPTPGIISIRGHYPATEDENFQKYLVLGPMARYAEDVQLAMKVLVQKSERDVRLDEPVDIKKLKVFYLEDAGRSLGLIPTAECMRESIRKAAAYLKDRAGEVKQWPYPDMHLTADISISLFFSMKDVPQLLMDPNDPKHEKAVLGESIKSIFGLSQYTKNTIFIKLMKDLNGLIPTSRLPRNNDKGMVLRQKFIEMLGDDAVFIYPTHPKTPSFKNLTILELAGGMYCLLWNVFGFPATHVPMGLNDEGLPVGFQVVAAPYQDRLCLAVAQELQNGFGGWVPPLST